jgi:hypothetical protein
LLRVTAATAGATLLAAAALAGPRETSEGPRIERKTLEEYIRFLASDGLGGRGNGMAGLEEAALYIADRFQTMKLRPAGDGVTYFQRFRVMTGREIGRHTGAVLRTADGRRELRYPSDFEPLTFSASGELEGSVVFAGYGVTAPEHDYDDYASIQAQGKLVLLLRYAPAAFGEHGWHATFVRKAENALSHGARAVLVVNGPLSHREDKLVPFGADTGSEALAIPVVHLRREHAEELLRASGRTLRELQKSIDEDMTPSSFELEGVSVSLTVDVRRTAVEVQNVLGFLPPAGRDANPGLARSAEHIVIGAHYDHLGLGEQGSRDGRARGSVHNGADDNASGVAGVLELARLFSQLPDRPRGILFAAFAGEELGLKGSYYYTAHPTVPLRNAVAMINLDMIGRLRHHRLYLGGIELFTQQQAIVEEMLDAEGLSSSSRFTAEEASDHTPFTRAGVPALLVFTGLHGDYHKPTDDPQFINFEGMEQVLRFGFNLSDHLLRTGERPVYAGKVVSSDPGVAPRSWEGTAYFGIGVDASFEGEGVRFAYVAYDGPAARAGLEAGDVLLEIDGRAIRSSGRAAVIMRERRPGETVSAKVRRKDKILEVKVQLSRWP